MDIIYNEKTKMWEKKKEPFIVLEIETEEDYNKLQKAVKQYQKQDNRGWIKSEEQLPDDGDCVLVLASGNVGDEILIEAYMLAEYYKDEGFILEEYPAAEDIFIEWWMSLPEPPEEAL